MPATISRCISILVGPLLVVAKAVPGAYRRIQGAGADFVFEIVPIQGEFAASTFPRQQKGLPQIWGCWMKIAEYSLPTGVFHA